MNGSSSTVDNLVKVLNNQTGATRQSLPPESYSDTRVLDLEMESIFNTEWLCVGRTDDVPKAGDFFTLNLVGEPLLVVRSDDGEIRVLSNVCRHRSMQVASGQGNKRLFVCPYHAWSYTNDGALKTAPLIAGDELDKFNCSLPSFPTELWMGFIFVSLGSPQEGSGDKSRTPLKIAERLSKLEPYITNYHGEQMHRVHEAQEIWPCNWKSLVENFMEGYHLSTVHPVTLGNITPTRLCEKLPGNEFYTAYRAHYPENAAPREYWHPDVTDVEKNSSTLYSVFPGLVVSQSPDVIAWLALTPIGTDKVQVRWGISSFSASPPQEEIDSWVHKWEMINEEDRVKLDKVREGLASRHSTRGPLAPDDFEGTISDFHVYLHSRYKLFNTQSE